MAIKHTVHRGIPYPDRSEEVDDAKHWVNAMVVVDSEIAAAKREASPYKTELSANDDLNDYTSNGVWRSRVASSSATISNRPPSAPDQPFRLEVFEIGWNNFHQVYTGSRDGTMNRFERYYYSGQWFDWLQVFDSAADTKPDPENGSDAPSQTDRKRITVFGDSQVAGTSMTTALSNAVGQDVTVTNGGRGGDTVDEVAIRSGVKELWFTIQGDVIPTSGTVELTTPQPLDTRYDTEFTGTLAGVEGTLTYVGVPSSWEFTRTNTGDTVTASEPQRFIPVEHGAQNETLIIWMGGNNTDDSGERVAATVAEHIVATYQAFMTWAAPQKRVLLPGMTYGANSEPGEPRYELVEAVNQRLADLYPAHYCAVNDYLIHHAMEDAGLSDTQEDIDARQAGLMPPSLLQDNVHFRWEVRAETGRYLAKQLQQRGWQ